MKYGTARRHLRLLSGVFALVLILTGHGYAQTTQNDALVACKQIAMRLGKLFDSSRASADLEAVEQAADPERRHWIIKQDELRFVVDGISRQVRTMFDYAVERELLQRPRGGRSKFQNDSDGWAAADVIRDSLGYNAMTRSRIEIVPNEDVHPTSHRGRVFATYCDVVGGISTNCNGNTLTLILDSETGSVVALSSVSGYTYGPSEENVTEQQAATNAARATGLPVDDAIVKGPYWQVPGGRFDQGKGATYAKQNVVRLCYLIGFKPDVQVLVDAVTGDVIGGDLAKSATNRSKSDDARLASNPVNEGPTGRSDVPLLVAIGVVAIAPILVYLLRRRSLRQAS